MSTPPPTHYRIYTFKCIQVTNAHIASMQWKGQEYFIIFHKWYYNISIAGD